MEDFFFEPYGRIGLSVCFEDCLLNDVVRYAYSYASVSFPGTYTALVTQMYDVAPVKAYTVCLEDGDPRATAGEIR